METDDFLSRKVFPQKGQNLESVETKIRNIFIQCLVFNKAIIPFTLVGYELMIADSMLHTSSKSSYPTRIQNIILDICQFDI